MVREYKIHLSEQEKESIGWYELRSDLELSTDLDICKHKEYCTVSKIKIDCSNYQDCQIWKYYNDYGEELNWLGI